MGNHVPEHDETPTRASILVIDDEEAVRGLFRAILEPIGYSVIEASNGRDGIRRFHESPTNVVITDLSMPAGDGAVLRTHQWGPGVELGFGFDTIETTTSIGAHALRVLAFALVGDRPDLDPTLEPIELVAAAFRGDSAASAHVRCRLDELRRRPRADRREHDARRRSPLAEGRGRPARGRVPRRSHRPRRLHLPGAAHLALLNGE